MKEFATNLIINGPKIGGTWDKIIRSCERAIETVKPGTTWRRRDQPDGAVRSVDKVERYTLELVPGLKGGRNIGLTRVFLNQRRAKGIRGDVFLKDFVPVEAKP